MWRVAANKLNKQSRTAEKGWSSRLGLGEGLTIPLRKKKKRQVVTKCDVGSQMWTETLERPGQRKMDMRFGICNVKSLYRTGSLRTVAREIPKHDVDLVAIKRSDETRTVDS
jgi:hypothetical protein